MTVLQRLLRGAAALLFLLLGDSAIAIAYVSCGGKFGWSAGWNRIVEKGPRATVRIVSYLLIVLALVPFFVRAARSGVSGHSQYSV